MIKDEDKARLSGLLKRLRLKELRDRTMTPAELAEHRQLEREMQKDYDDEKDGDWTR